MSGTKNLTVTKRLVPDYYPEFHCLMGSCRDNCCQGGWNIDFSKKDYLKIRRAVQETGLEEPGQTVLQRYRGEDNGEKRYAHFRLDAAGRCPLQSAEGLCTLQLTCGEQTLPYVCRSFPRAVYHGPDGCLVQACSTGCEATLALLYRRKEGMGFVDEPLPPEERREVEFPDTPLYGAFGALRELCVDILQDRRGGLSQRLLMLGLALKELDELSRAGRWDGLPRWFSRCRAMADDPSVWSGLEELPGDKTLFLLNNLKRLTVFKSSMPELERMRAEILSHFRPEKGEDEAEHRADLRFYPENEQRLSQRFGDLEFFFENILVNTIFFTGFPMSSQGDSIWETYVTLCSTYSFMRFFTVCACPEGEQELFHALTLASRALLHSQGMTAFMTSSLFQNDSATLAHMAILVQG